MIISHKYQFIFIKNGKTAGTSIEVFLSKFCGSFDIVTPIYPAVESHFPRNYAGFYNRMTSAEIREKIGKKTWKNYFKFCVERNPWDKAISYYYMAKCRTGGNLSLDKFLDGCEFPINFPRYTEPGNSSKIIVDKIIDFNNLIEGLGEVFGRLGLPFDGSLGVYAKSEYRTDRRPYQEVLTASQARKIQEIFAVEIDLHGYHFQKVKLIA
ncbi:hypothetical protein Noc_1229 [Nitrosococcus oceani ATCC 19707]|uniref:Chondroitin 4-O-sulfotransferase n=2 Tax=Nitrosococcus oceani TaxID=1229 RepID=Q3JBR6_NITOC|nr:sulfotransferase family 2 domain-containing protein [Nitrosococcus oceani]ABA57730.1 hypothetical protein Noc_1229 [Nitrosococcus oceani ATCC 19707]EDZ66819.1 hypothetical protein NOC27_146 [Nitrosococcus oceani AFC27]KFI19817.1 hypothetical protein IB75_06415 [Nitrosococcus oceani C-27]GEM19385.1 hypothetical protein NONS58_07700 [Nitrosococcus oceani]